MWRAPCPAPKRCSATAPALASFSILQASPNSFSEYGSNRHIDPRGQIRRRLNHGGRLIECNFPLNTDVAQSGFCASPGERMSLRIDSLISSIARSGPWSGNVGNSMRASIACRFARKYTAVLVSADAHAVPMSCPALLPSIALPAEEFARLAPREVNRRLVPRKPAQQFLKHGHYLIATPQSSIASSPVLKRASSPTA